VAASLTEGSWPAVTLEQVLDWNADVILDLSLAASATPRQVEEAYAFWQTHRTLGAVRAGRVIVVHSGVLVRPGPRLGAVAETLAGIVHGDG
jgi:ABC-type Fe3+-hydroxamate transport system substrate-binding protein